MKKLSEEQKARHLRLRAKRDKRRVVSKTKAAFRRRYGPEEAYRTRKFISSKYFGQRIPLPANFSLEDDRDAVLGFIEELRQQGVRDQTRIFADFRPLHHVGPAGALMLAAELDRWRRLKGLRLVAIDHKKWDPEIRRLMNEMGLFEVLDARRTVTTDQPLGGATRFIQFRTGNRANGLQARSLQNAIEAITGSMPSRRTLFRGLTEAMTNVAHHAYPDDASYRTQPLRGQWWMTGSYNTGTKRLIVVFYDQGVGIPYTLPRKHPKERIQGILNRLGLVDDDVSRIRCAMELGRSRTGADHRGGGLFRDIRQHTMMVPHGRLRVLSGAGEYIFEPEEAEPDRQERLLTHAQDIGGTLIQWEATLSETPEQ